MSQYTIGRYRLYIFEEKERSWRVGREPEADGSFFEFHLPKAMVQVDEIYDEDGVQFADFELPYWLALQEGLEDEPEEIEQDEDGS